MENCIYYRQVAKQSLSRRVVDKHQIQRRYTSSELSELYKFNHDVLFKNRSVLNPPKDKLLADLIDEHEGMILRYHEHDTLLENQPEEDLSDEQRNVAMKSYRDERRAKKVQTKASQSSTTKTEAATSVSTTDPIPDNDEEELINDSSSSPPTNSS